MIEMVPVGATVVTLQLRSICIGRMRLPSASRAHVSSGPQIERAHSGNGPRSLARRSLSRFDSTSRNSITLRPNLDAFRRVVRDAEAHERVGEAHDAEADAADALGERVDLGQRVLVDVDDVVEEVRAEVDVALERIPVHAAVDHVVPDVDAAEVADVVREQRLLAAGVGRLVLPEVRHRVVAVRLVDEEAARLAGAPRALDHAVPHHLRVELAGDFLGDGIHEVVRLTGAQLLDELRGDGHGDVEVHDLREVFLARNELQDVRMIDAQDAHVRAATRAALLHRIRGRVVELHEGDRPRRDAGGRAHHGALRAQTRKGEARCRRPTGG